MLYPIKSNCRAALPDGRASDTAFTKTVGVGINGDLQESPLRGLEACLLLGKVNKACAILTGLTTHHTIFPSRKSSIKYTR
jgi:hypothetical protein